MIEITDVASAAVVKVGDVLSKYGVEVDESEMVDLYEVIVQIIEYNVGLSS